jgi:3-deoxy-D-manno-octulosonic-acid transferase
VADMEEGVRTALAIVADGARREAMSQAGLRFAAAHQGAAGRTADAVLVLIGRRR